MDVENDDNGFSPKRKSDQLEIDGADTRYCPASVTTTNSTVAAQAPRDGASIEGQEWEI